MEEQSFIVGSKEIIFLLDIVCFVSLAIDSLVLQRQNDSTLEFTYHSVNAVERIESKFWDLVKGSARFYAEIAAML